jgi:murein DD-endopeptidase MepM/ murein hydrolase activator NlpD
MTGILLKQILQISLFLILCTALSCGHFQGPEYSGDNDYVSQGEFSTSQELYNSKELIHPQRKTQPTGPFRLQWPVRKMSLSRGFKDGGSRRKTHLGLDIRGRRGDPIFAAHDGVVIYAGSGFRGYGKMIILEYDDTWATLYGHLNSFKVKTGDEVSSGALLGTMGRTGRASGVHLHFELIRNKTPIDPEPLLKFSRGVASL